MRKILFLEDNAFFAESLTSFLEVSGFQVKFTPSVAEAVSWFDQENFDAVITDVHLKGANWKTSTGFGLVKHVRRRRGLNTVVVVITGLELLDENVVKARGVDLFYYKPLKEGFDSFLIDLNEAISQRTNENLKIS